MNLKVEKFIAEFETVYFVFRTHPDAIDENEYYELMEVVSVNGYSGNSEKYLSYLEKKCDEFEEGIMDLINSDGEEAVPYISSVFSKLKKFRGDYYNVEIQSPTFSNGCPGIYYENATTRSFYSSDSQDDEDSKLNGHYLYLAMGYLYHQQVVLTKAIFNETAYLRIAANHKADSKLASSDSDPVSPKIKWEGDPQLFFLIFSALKDLQYIRTIGIKKDSLKSYSETLQRMIYVENPDKKGEEFTEDSFYQKMKLSNQKESKYSKAFEVLKRTLSTLLASHLERG